METADRLRINYIYIVFLFLFFLLSLRIVYLQAFKKNFFRNLAKNQYYRLLPVEGKRGTIFDRKGRIFATGINTHSVFADPALIKNSKVIARTLSSYLGLPEQSLEDKLKKKKRFVWVKRKISWAEKEKIKSLKLKGIGFMREQKRFYPQENLAASLLGVVDIDNKGLDGLELFYDNDLRGKSGLVRVLQDSASNELIIDPLAINPKEGADMFLTIDAQVQYWVESYLQETIKKFSAKEGSVIVMNAITGEVIALANYPTFNPNDLSGISKDAMRNRAVCDMFEPGSVFKVVTLLAAIEENKFSDEDKIFCENGSFKIPGSVLHDWKPYGMLNFKEVFKKSSNIGVGKIANSLGRNTFYRYIKKLGFGEKTGIDIPGEIGGSLKPLSRWSNTSGYIIPIGQEIGINLIQLVRLFAVVANDGYLVKPHLLKNISTEGFSKNMPTKRKRVISSSTAERAKNILISVVEEGTGALARIEGAKIGGKTGTAQKYDPEIRRYSPTQYRASFVGFISDLEPPLVIGVTIFEPKKSHFGGVVAAPLFKKIAQKLIDYWGRKRISIDESPLSDTKEKLQMVVD